MSEVIDAIDAIEVDIAGVPGEEVLRIKLAELNSPVKLSAGLVTRGARVMSPGWMRVGAGAPAAGGTVVMIPLYEDGIDPCPE